MSNILLAPGIVKVKFALAPVYNNLASLYMLDFADAYPEVGEWLRQTATGLSPERIRTNWLLLEILYSAFEPDEDLSSFPAYLDHLAEAEPMQMRNRFLRHMFPERGEEYARRDQLADLDTFIAEIDHSEFDREFDRDLFVQAHTLLSDPPAMRAAILSHLKTMWHHDLAAEWAHNQTFLTQIVDTFQSRDYAGLSAYEAIQSVTGREVHGCWQQVLATAKTLVFIPSPHIGPYLLHYAYPPVVRVIFGADSARRVESSSMALNRADFLVQLRALADETRLRILELLSQEDELCAQEIVTRLELTKSSASRHLSQLSATGYLVERQGQGKTKCYALNPERFRETARFLELYART
jgi:DNA-binding transcriptional ArsR family regulator